MSGVIPRAVDGGLSDRTLGGAPLIDYNELAVALSKQPIYTSTKEITASQGRMARARSFTTLGRK